MMNKKALVARQFVIVLLLAIGFVFLVIFILRANLNPAIDREACHQSVLFRATAPLGAEFIPLNCKTERICVNKGKDCVDSSFGKPSRDNPVTSEKISNKIDVEDVIIDILVDCHSTLGEGKIDFTNTVKLGSDNYCLICSRFALDYEALEEVDEISYLELYQRMKQRKTNSGLTYLEYVYGTDSVNDMAIRLESAVLLANQKGSNFHNIEDLKIDLTRENVVIVMVTKTGLWKEASIGTVVVVGAALVLTPFTGGLSTAVGIVLLSGGVAGGVVHANYDEEKDFTYFRPSVQPYDLESLRELKCTSFETAP